MFRIQVYRNKDQGCAWLAEGDVGDCAYYDGADTLAELKAQIADFWAGEDVALEVVLVTDPDEDGIPIEAPLLLVDH